VPSVGRVRNAELGSGELEKARARAVRSGSIAG
jgi:hypothetical protein